MSGRRPERAQPILRGRKPTQFLHGRGRDTATCDPLCDPVSELSCAVREIDQVEPAQHRAVFVNERMEDARASFLLGQ
jgi:hypothetical protein